MKRVFLLSLTLAILSFAGFAQAPTAPTTNLKVGDKAPEFELPDTTGNKVKLADFRGKKNVVLAFYVLAFTGG